MDFAPAGQLGGVVGGSSFIGGASTRRRASSRLRTAPSSESSPGVSLVSRLPERLTSRLDPIRAAAGSPSMDRKVTPGNDGWVDPFGNASSLCSVRKTFL